MFNSVQCTYLFRFHILLFNNIFVVYQLLPDCSNVYYKSILLIKIHVLIAYICYFFVVGLLSLIVCLNIFINILFSFMYILFYCFFVLCISFSNIMFYLSNYMIPISIIRYGQQKLGVNRN